EPPVLEPERGALGGGGGAAETGGRPGGRPPTGAGGGRPGQGPAPPASAAASRLPCGAAPPARVPLPDLAAERPDRDPRVPGLQRHDLPRPVPARDR